MSDNNDNRDFNLQDVFFNDEIVINAIRRATREAMKRHIAAGVPMISWENGQVVEISPEELAKTLESD